MSFFEMLKLPERDVWNLTNKLGEKPNSETNLQGMVLLPSADERKMSVFFFHHKTSKRVILCSNFTPSVLMGSTA